MRKLPITEPLDVVRRADAGSANAGPAVPAHPLHDVRDEDLHDILTAFYDTIEQDELLAPYFIDLDMDAHMPRIVAFWSTILFHTGQYSGNAFRPHMSMPGLTAAHFARWVATLERTVDARHAGESAERMKDFAHRIAISMQLRLGITPGGV